MVDTQTYALIIVMGLLYQFREDPMHVLKLLIVKNHQPIRWQLPDLFAQIVLTFDPHVRFYGGVRCMNFVKMR